MIKAVLFDMDGTLIDSEDMHTLSLKEAIKEILGVDIPKEEIEKYVGFPYVEKLKMIFNEDKKEFEKVAQLALEKNKKYIHLVKLPPEVKKILKNLRKKFKIGLVTASTKNQAEPLLEMVDIKKYFDIIVTRDDVKKNKPYPDPYLFAANRLDLKPEECVVVEDSNTGLKSGKSAGMKCIIIKHIYNNDQDFSGADFILEDRNQLTTELIMSLG
ncbi:MAG: HAD family phosphatase [Candidatus Aenigmatarchaeota archaeon]